MRHSRLLVCVPERLATCAVGACSRALRFFVDVLAAPFQSHWREPQETGRLVNQPASDPPRLFLACLQQCLSKDRSPSGMSDQILLRAFSSVAAAIRGCAGVYFNASSPPKCVFTPEWRRSCHWPEKDRRKARLDVPFGCSSSSEQLKSKKRYS